ncbi:hypothetical protein RND81_06G204900 [Saponaria officinalis]|uniref:DOG1 domain-containing protein n=1 Tax=Saponaria officinalis TaxID=3572 RepID=A0AAW1KC15_SAPOF
MTSGLPPSSSNSSYSFKSFLRGWHHQQDQLLTEITAALKSEVGRDEAEVAKELISRALSHFEEYYEHKSRAAHNNVFSMFSPPWSSSFECAFLWISGFRPGVLLELVPVSVLDLSPRQAQSIYRLKRETRVVEKNISDELARIQENMAAPPMIHALRGSTEEQPSNPETDNALDQLQVVLEEVVANADTLRLTTAASVVDLLTPPQALRFLTAFIRLQQTMRSLGLERDSHRARGRSS